MARTKILILDDERDWLYRHKGWLEEAGFECIATQLAEEAVAIAIEDPSIQIAIIDEILEVDGLKQDMQGSDVREEIRKQRSNIQFIIVTYSPQFKAEDRTKERSRNISDVAVFLEEQRKLERESQVIHVFHKCHLDNKQTQNIEYQYLIQEIKQLLKASQYVNIGQLSQIILPSIWIVLTVSGGFFSGLEGRTRQKPRDFFQDNFGSQTKLEPPEMSKLVRTFARQIRELDKSNRCENSVAALSKQPKFQILKRALYSKKPGGRELKELRLSKPGSRKYFQPLIKPNTRLFSILEFLAWKVEGGGEKSISEDEFRILCGKPIRVTNNNAGISIAIRTYGNAFDEDGAFGSGVGTEGEAQKKLGLKVAIQRIEDKLADPKFGFPSKKLFSCEEGKSTYTPLFDIGILFERADAAPNKR